MQQRRPWRRPLQIRPVSAAADVGLGREAAHTIWYQRGVYTVDSIPRKCAGPHLVLVARIEAWDSSRASVEPGKAKTSRQ